MPALRTELLEGATCENLEDEYDEAADEFEEASEADGLENPGDFDAGEGADIPDDPNIDVDVDTDVDVDVETDLDVDVDVDVTLELFFEEEVSGVQQDSAFVSGDESDLPPTSVKE